MTKIDKDIETKQGKVEASYDRPRRRSFESKGNLQFPPIPGYVCKVFAVDDPKLVNEVQRAEDQGFVPVQAHEIGYDSRIANPLKPDSRVYVALGSNIKGLLMKLPVELADQDIIDENNYVQSKIDQLTRKGDKNTGDPNLIMTDGVLTHTRQNRNRIF